MSSGLSGIGGVSDSKGHYVLHYFMPPCPCFSIDYPNMISAELRYVHFNPKEDSRIGSYFDYRFNHDFCTCISACPFGYTLGGLLANIAVIGIEASIATPSFRINFPINAMALTGEAVLRNQPRPGIGIDPQTVGDIPQEADTEYALAPFTTDPWQPDTEMDLDDDGQPDLTRAADYLPNDSEQGLLKQINKSDLRDTDIYVYRVSTGQLVASMEGIIESGVSNDTESLINFRLLMPHWRGYTGAYAGHYFKSFMGRTLVGPEFSDRNADHLRAGDQVKIVVINRATGYIGTARGHYGGRGGQNIKSGLIGFFPEPSRIAMRPPNLKVKAERVYDIDQHFSTASDENTNLIGYEGSGLTSDRHILITTEWVDWDGSPLPADLPGYTGRLAKVVSTDTLGQASGQIANFEIKPGLRTQVVKLPQPHIDNAHFYIHVNGEPPSRNPNFSSIGAGAGPLQYRPKHYVAVRVPVFNEIKTNMAAQSQIESLQALWQPGDPAPVLEDLQKVYDWPYRPELQFSLFDLEVDETKLKTAYNSDSDRSETVLELTYNLNSDISNDPLERFGPDRSLLWSLGYSEIYALLGNDQVSEFQAVELLHSLMPAQVLSYDQTAFSRLEPEDYLSLQLYQADDAGNGLVNLFGLPLVFANAEPFTLERTYHMGEFDSSVPAILNQQYTDSYQLFPFELLRDSKVSVKILDHQENEIGEAVSEVTLPPGQRVFLLDFGTAVQSGADPTGSSDFYVRLLAEALDGSFSQEVTYQGKLETRREGKMLGQTMAHDVLIQDGSLNLNRQDLAVNGRGPRLEFSRTYNNQGQDDALLSPGWGHNYNLQLRAAHSPNYAGGSVPVWVNNLRGSFFERSQIPDFVPDWNVVYVNGTTFKKHGGKWYPQRGRHGTLTQSVAGFTYTAKDGTQYNYDHPLWLPPEDGTPPVPPTYISFGDNMITRLGLPRVTLDPGDPGERGKPAQGPFPSVVKSIRDRNGNTMTFKYDDQFTNRLVQVTDAVGRKLTFEYEDVEVTTFFTRPRLVRVNGPDGIALNFGYNEQGLLETARRSNRTETYAYAPESPLNNKYNLVKTTDANSHSYQYAYHDQGEVASNLLVFVKALKDQEVIKSVTYPDGNTASFQYVLQSENKRTVNDLRGNDTTYILNLYGNPKRIIEPGGRETVMTWSIDEGKPDNVMTSRSDGRGFKTAYEHDAKGNITLETDPYGNAIQITWDQQFSLPLTRTDRNGVAQSWDYDAKGNLLKFTDGDSKSTSYTYYASGERRTMTTPRGHTTNHTYDANGNPDTVVEPEGSETDSDYDVRGRLAAKTDPEGNRTLYTYDGLDYPDRTTYPQITAYSLPAGSGRVEDFDYDAVGNLLKKTNRMGLAQTFTYTVRDQVESITRNIGGTKTFDYDANGNLISESDWKGKTTTHDYDTLNQRVSTTNRLGHTMTMDYDLSGNLIEVVDYEGNTAEHEYDRLNRLTDTWEPALGGQTAGHLQYAYYDEADPKINLKSETDQEGNTTAYEYNGRYLRDKRTNAINDEFSWDYDDNGNLVAETDEEGNLTEYEYDKQNRRTAMIQPGNIRTEYRYDDNGNRTYVLDALQRETETQYDAWNRPYRVIDPDNYETVIAYDGGHNKVRQVDGNGHSKTWERDRRGLVLTATDAEGHSTQYTYDPNGNVKTVTNARGMVIQTTYDFEDRELVITEALGSADERSRQFLSRDKMGNPLQVSDFNGNITVTEYNDLYLPEKVFDPQPFGGQYTETKYYKTGKVKSVRDRRGYSTAYVYDELSREILVTDALSRTIETTYDKVGNVKTIKDKRNIITENFYDDLYRLVRKERAGIRLVSNEYDDVGNLTAAVDANTNRIEYAYNDRNLLTKTLYSDNNTEDRTYDGVGNLLTVTNEENRVTTYTYDKENRESSTTFAGETTSKLYDDVGNLVSITKPAGNCRVMAYDRLNRLTLVVEDPSGPVGDMDALDPRCTLSDNLNLSTSYEYDDNDNLIHQYDASGYHVEYTYDALNRKTRHIQHKAGGNLTLHYVSYDGEGNLTEMIDAKGQRFTYAYDAMNRRTDTFFPNVATPYLAIAQTQTEYDANNNVTKITETKNQSDGGTVIDVTVNTYDNLDRLETSTQRGVTVDYEYDDNGNRTSVSSPNGTTTYSYNSRNRLKTGIADGYISTYTYYPDGKKKAVFYPNGTEINYTYFDTNRVETVVNKVSIDDTLISSFSYEYDANGNRTEQIQIQDGETEATDYAYDANDRLAAFTVTAGTDITVTEYTYDGYNRSTETVTENDVLVKSRSYTYDETNWLTEIEDDTDPQDIKTITYAYDLNGNTVGKSDSSLVDQDLTFAYDSRNQLVQTIRGPPAGQTILGQYDYNAGGLRVRHRYSERGDVDYYYDDKAVIEERLADDGSLLAHYRYAYRLISLTTATSIQYYHYDGLDSTVNLTTESAAVQVSYTLDPWGHIRSQNGTSVNRQIFTGQEHDENTDLIYFGARYYDPDTGRFITQDIYIGELNTPPSLHRYLYAYSNPTVFIDLYGFISNRQWMGVDEESIDRSLSEDPSMKNVLKITAKKTAYDVWNFITGGFVERQDIREEKLDRGEITEKDYWLGTGLDAGVSIASQAVGGKVGGAVSSKVTSAVGSKFVGTVVSGGVTSGMASAMEQSAQVITYHATEGRLGDQKELDFKKIALSAGTGMAVSGTMYGLQQGAQKAKGVYDKIKGKSIKPTTTGELRSGACFVSGTLVITSVGLISIEEIRAGDLVLSRNEKSGAVEYRTVLRTKVTPDQKVLSIKLVDDNDATETYEATQEHPFWVKQAGWKKAAELLPGDEIFSSSGGWLRVAGNTWLPKRQTVYNFEVDEFHTYFVGKLGAWVHNSNECFKTGKISTTSAEGQTLKRGTGGKGYRTYDTGAHKDLSPNINRAPGHSTSVADRRIQSHHPIQQKWAKENVVGYNPKEAPTVLLPTGKGDEHSIISGLQKRTASGAGNTLREEFNRGYRQMIDAGVDPKVAQKAMKKNYKYFIDKLGVSLD